MVVIAFLPFATLPNNYVRARASVFDAGQTAHGNFAGPLATTAAAPPAVAQRDRGQEQRHQPVGGLVVGSTVQILL
jgi:hypothetical protein